MISSSKLKETVSELELTENDLRNPDQYLSLQDVVKLSRLSEVTVRRHIHSGQLVAERPGHVGGNGSVPYRISVIDFHVWMRNERNTKRVSENAVQ